MIHTDCLILTTGHHSDDARLNRHVAALEDEGISTRLVAIPASRSMRLVAAPVLVYRCMRAVRAKTVMFPDPELFVTGPLIARRMGVRSVLDVHEDYGAVALSRDWIPRPLRSAVGSVVRAVVNRGKRLANATIVAAPRLADGNDHVVLNIPSESHFTVQNTNERRMSVVYVGDITETRGALDMLEVIEGVPEMTLELIGPFTQSIAGRVREEAQARGIADRIVMTGRLEYREAWERASGAFAGLSMLQPTAAYKEAIPSKLWEYMAVGLPIIASNLPAQRALIDESGAGVVVEDPAQATALLREWLATPELVRDIASAGSAYYRTVAATSSSTRELVAAVTGQ